MKIKLATILKYGGGLLFLCIIGFIYLEVKSPTDLRRFRRTDHAFSKDLPVPPSRKGLDHLYISGSARISQPSLQKAIGDIDKAIYVVDLLGEPHCFIQGLPARWYGYKPDQLIANTPGKLGFFHIRHMLRRLLRTGKLHHTNQDAQTEKEMIEQAGYHYIQANFTRGDAPSNDQVDQLIKDLQGIPEGSWVHFHCSAGQGRTTIAMAMYDILKNSKNVSLEDIIKRQYSLGGVDLFDTVVWPNGTYTKEALENRSSFITKFYQYVTDPNGLNSTSWKEWIRVNNNT
ncbi:MAG: hypothetical protein JSR85_01460 [Proteobacteria bacterium]|nr:hypothetical protein [Pseudomonadota bacterium]